MNLTIREAQSSSDREALAHVWSEVYRRGDASLDPTTMLRAGERGMIAEHEGRPVGGYSVVSLPTARGEGELRCAGVGGVAVLPEHRVLGVGGELMRHSIETMRQWGYSVAALYPFRASYYRRFDYEVSGLRLEIRCPQARIPSIRPTQPVRRLSGEDAHQLDEAYVPFIRGMSGGVLRDAEAWKNRMGDKSPMIYAIGDPVQAYAWTHFEGEFWQELRFGEVAWTTPGSYRELLALIGGLTINRSEAVWYEPSNSPFVTGYMDVGVKVTAERLAMYRVLDVPAALRGLRCADSGEFTILVEDALCIANCGPWHVEFSPAGVQVEPCREASIRLGIRSFTQALMGEPSLAALALQGLVRCDDRASLESAKRLLTPASVLLTEFF